MTQTANVPALGPVLQILRETVRPEPQPETPPSRAPLLYVGASDTLIPCPKIKEPRRRGIAMDTAITLCAEHAGAPDQKPHPPDQALAVSAYASRETSRARALGCTDLYGFVRICTESVRFVYGKCTVFVRRCTVLGCSPPALERYDGLTNRRRIWKKSVPCRSRSDGRGAIEQQRHPEPSRLPAGVRREHNEHGQRLPHPAIAAPQGGAPTMAVARHCQPSECHLGTDYHRPSTPPA